MKDARSIVPQPIVGVIPARYGSTRFPGKLLATLGDRTVLRHVYERVSRCGKIDRIIIATDDDRILREVLAFGGAAVMTSPSHRSGTDRVAEVVRGLGPGAALVVNIQGDEPFIDPNTIDAVAVALRADPSAVWTAVAPISDPSALRRGDVVKAAVAQDGRVLYFSRAPVPYDRDGGGLSVHHRHHIGIYGYTTDLLERIVELPPSPLEQLESLEQLRILEAGITIRAVAVAHGFGGIDSKEDLERARHILASKTGWEETDE